MEMTTDSSQSKVLIVIVYKTIEHPHLIQEFNYEGFDLPPEYPYFDKFMDYWRHHIPSIILEIRGSCHPDELGRYVHLQDKITIH